MDPFIKNRISTVSSKPEESVVLPIVKDPVLNTLWGAEDPVYPNS